MSCFVLVHGAWHGSWCWQRVRKRLRSAGHEVFTPTLTGVGERSHLIAPGIDLETHVLDVVDLIRWEELEDIVLCGHSYGGCVVTAVADRVSERVRSLVYLDAFVPEQGQCLEELLPDALRERMRARAEAEGEGWRAPPIPAEVYNVNAGDREWVDRQCTPHPMGCFRQPVTLTGGIDEVSDVTYIYATEYAVGPFEPFYRKAQARGWKTRTVSCGHDVMLDRPDELAEMLLGLTPASRSTRAPS